MLSALSSRTSNALGVVARPKAQRFVRVPVEGEPQQGFEIRPPMWRVYAALLCVQTSFGCGNVLGKVGMPDTNPVLFALFREGLAGPILLLMGVCSGSFGSFTRSSLPRFLVPGLCLFGNQLFFIVGLKLGNEVNAAVWAIGQPIYTAAIAIAIGWEKASLLKVLGFVCACGGALFIILNGPSETSADEHRMHVVSNLLFFCNGMCQSVYVITTKRLLRSHPAIAVTGLSYSVACVLMLAACVVVNNNEGVFRLVAPDCKFSQAWVIPTAALPALAFWVLFCSVLAYALMTWANRYAQASLVSSFVVCQPITSALLASLFIAVGYNPNNVLKPPDTGNLGGLGIVLGLALLMWEDSTSAARRTLKSVELADVGAQADTVGIEDDLPIDEEGEEGEGEEGEGEGEAEEEGEERQGVMEA